MFNGCISYKECLAVPCWPLFFTGTVMKNCFSFMLQQCHILCFQFLHYLVTVFQMGLGVPGPTEWPPESQPYSMCFLFVGLGQRGNVVIKMKNI